MVRKDVVVTAEIKRKQEKLKYVTAFLELLLMSRITFRP